MLGCRAHPQVLLQVLGLKEGVGCTSPHAPVLEVFPSKELCLGDEEHTKNLWIRCNAQRR